ncbi:hypothetical protein ACFUJR_31890 [Streptomyces sp. NPDC057271]|uniref:hypothetical protein n=1 Tax=unclassified Streptomyces TaxID=2593676 RepID=UPI003630E089
MSAAVTLYVISAVLEVGGIIKTVWDIGAARRSLRDFIRRPLHVYASDVAVATEAYNASIVTGEPMTLERRGDCKSFGVTPDHGGCTDDQ